MVYANALTRMLTEGSNKTDSWSSFLPLVQRIINASELTSTGYSPSQLMFGDSVDHRHGLFPGSDNLTPPTTDIDEWIHELIVKQTAMFEVARSHQEEINEANIAKRVELRGARDLASYATGAYVLVKYPHSNYGRGPPTKFMPFWRGPMRVERSEGDRYRLRNLVTGKEADFHIQLLKPFLYDERVTEPLAVAIQEHGEYLVDEILNHRYAARVNGKPRGLECLVRWVGYQEQSWEPLVNLKKLVQFHSYARVNGLTRWIPPALRGEIVRSVGGRRVTSGSDVRRQEAMEDDAERS